MRRTLLLVACVTSVAACGAPPPARPPAVRAAEVAPALTALRAGQFQEAERAATAVLTADPGAPTAAAVRAIAVYVQAGDQLAGDLEKVVESADAVHYFDHEAGRAIWTRFLGQLEAVDRDLAVAEADPQFALELCPSCWGEHDWNHNGRIDDRDRRLLEIERAPSGELLAPDDPRRRPTFRFDLGDVLWARAMIAFQHAAVELVLAYRWSELDRLFLGRSDRAGGTLVIHLIDRDRVTRARTDLIAALAFSERERAAYLAETDDDREWVPNPRQTSHPMPMPVDAGLYATWTELLADARHLLASDEGISLRAAAGLVEPKLGALMPDGYLDLGHMLSEPADITFELDEHAWLPGNAERIARGILGHGYAEHMRPSPLVTRLRTMIDDLDHDRDTLGHKLQYLFWLN